MRRWLPLALGALLAGNLACGVCGSRADCDPGYYCDFDTSDCKLGCQSNEDCGGISLCNSATGSCYLPESFAPRADAGLTDTGTSSVADAGTSTVADAGS